MVVISSARADGTAISDSNAMTAVWNFMGDLLS
jgi:hypothetical protein